MKPSSFLRLTALPLPKICWPEQRMKPPNLPKKSARAVVLKIVSPDILHKSDAGGVKINLGTEKEIREAFDEIMENAKKFNANADIRGVLVSPMAADGVEIIIGTKIDDQFGPVIMYGLGGIMVEILQGRLLSGAAHHPHQRPQNDRRDQVLSHIKRCPGQTAPG